MYAQVLTIQSSKNNSLHIACSYDVAPAGDHVFSVLGEDRILYVAIDSELGKEYAVRVIKGMAWNVEIIKVGRSGTSLRYGIPYRFVRQLGLKKGDLVLVFAEKKSSMELIPLSIVRGKVGDFKEPLLRPHSLE
jgi:hypothetical protein